MAIVPQNALFAALIWMSFFQNKEKILDSSQFREYWQLSRILQLFER
jgi:hypothetical protein